MLANHIYFESAIYYLDFPFYIIFLNDEELDTKHEKAQRKYASKIFILKGISFNIKVFFECSIYGRGSEDKKLY